MRRLPRSATASFAFLFLIACHSQEPIGKTRLGTGPRVADEGDAQQIPLEQIPLEQIHWQRSLEDALAIAKADHLPLLIAVNMDGESASDRIVREQYRDPDFVAASRHYVCLVASVFRHNARDYDDQGRRIPCPRLGCCTCGEHMALEPLLFDRYLADGERVAPRHVVIGIDGKKAWDLSLSFDLKDIDRAMTSTAGAAVVTARPAPAALDWSWLASGRSHAARVQFEQAVAIAPGEDEFERVLRSIAANGDAGSLDALRLLAARLPTFSPKLRQLFVTTVQGRSLAVPVAAALRDLVQTIRLESGLVATGAEVWLSVLAELDAGTAATRALLLATCVAREYVGTGSIAATAFGTATATAIEATLQQHGGQFSFGDVWQAAAATRRDAAGAAPAPGPIADDMPSAEALTSELEGLDARLRQAADDVALRARYAKASLDLARRHLETGARDVAVLLADAERNFARVLAAEPQHAEWWIERARTAYFDGRFDDEAAHGRAALHAATGHSIGELPLAVPLQDAVAIEALRWLGDANARQFERQLAADPAPAAASMLEGLRAFALVATSGCGDDGDWTSFASFCGALGLWREQFAAARAGALRVPAGRAVRQCLNQALWNGGRAELVAPVADRICEQIGDSHPAFADASWFAGYAFLLQAENERRTEIVDAAGRSYAAARERFARAAAARADYADNCAYYVALAWLGSGLANVQVGRRDVAAEDLVAAVRAWQRLADATDGLGYTVLDLVDKLGEWRAAGPSDVDAMQLFDRLDEVAPQESFWAVAIADSQLREALRADGRNPVREERDTVDAAGNAMRMLMGLPNDEGDAYLRTSISLLRRVKDRLQTDEDKKALAQADTIWAERNLERARLDGVAEALTEAAALLGQPEPAPQADVQSLRATAASLRGLLGEARPRWRMGR